MIDITIDEDLFLDGLQYFRDEIPFAMSVSMNRTASRAVDQLREDLPGQFTIRNTRTQRGVQMIGSHKRHLEAQIGSRDQYMVLQTTGGEKRPEHGSDVVVPMVGPSMPRTTKRSTTPRRKWPSTLLRKQGTFAGIPKHWEEHPSKSKRAKSGVWQRFQRGSHRWLRLLYVFEPLVSIAPRWPLQQTVDHIFGAHWQDEAWRIMDDIMEQATRRRGRGGRRYR